jgi:hypothetical protein
VPALRRKQNKYRIIIYGRSSAEQNGERRKREERKRNRESNFLLKIQNLFAGIYRTK